MAEQQIGRAVRAAVTAVVTALVVMGVAACQPAPVPPKPPATTTTTTTTTTAPAPASAVLEVTYRPNGSGGSSLTYTVRCGPGAAASVTPAVTGLTAGSACATVNAQRTLLVEGPPRGEVCLFMIMGPQSAKVTGHVGNAPVDRWFGRNDSCADRTWWKVAGLFPPTPRS